MTERTEDIFIAEAYLREMLEADDTANFDLYTMRYEDKYLERFEPETFKRDIAEMHKRNGMNKGYEFLGTLRNSSVDNQDVFRSVWKGVYEKRDAIIEMGVYKKDGQWHVIKSSVY